MPGLIERSSGAKFSGKSFLAAALALGMAAATLAIQPQVKNARSERGNAVEAVRLNNLGTAYMNQRRSEAALKNFEQAGALNPNLPAARLNEGIALLDLQRLEPAERVLLEVTGKQPQNPRAWFNLGLLRRKLDETDQALAAFARVAELDPNDADTQYFLGALHQSAKQFDLAVASYRRALEINPFHVSAQFGLAGVYQRMGDSEEARKHLERFQKLTQEKLGAPIGTTYGDQGKYSLAEDVKLPAGAAAAPGAVKFVSVPGAESGLRFAAGKPVQGSPRLPACFLDYNNDGKADLLLLNNSSDRKGALYRNEGGRFADATAGAGLAIASRIFSYAVGDYDNDGWTDIVVALDESGLRLFHNEGKGTFRDVTDASGLAAITAWPFAVNLFDYDHDGDLDLYTTRRLGEPRLWRNNGNSTFTDISSTTLPAAFTADSQMSIVTDFDNDRAVDLVVTHSQQSPSLLRNPREGRFQVTPLLGAGPKPATRGVVAFDFDKDGWTDMAFTHAGSPGLSLWRNVEGKRLEAVTLPKLNWTDGWGLAAVDYDNDGWVDLAAVGSQGFRSRIALVRNEGSSGFRDATSETGLDKVGPAIPGSLSIADYDSDGDADFLVAQDGGPPLLLRNDGGNRNHSLRLSLKALADNRSAVGTKVEVFAGTLYQKFEVQSSSGYLGQNAPEILAGLGDVKEADIVRMLWPTGVLQDEVQLAADRPHQIAENDRRGSSCPILFAWNGEKYEFISDMIGPGIVGHWVAPGERNVPDPTEYVKVSSRSLRAQQGRLSLRLLEPMEEVVYLDHVRLIAIDHPPDVEIYPNERFASVPPFPEFHVIASRGARLPAGAWDDHGRDILRELRARDRAYVEGFRSLPFTGFAELHGIELELGPWDPAQPLRLLMHGLTDYFTATSVYAAHQAGIAAIPPYLEAQDAAGRWRRVVGDLGFPAGLARTMVADLAGRLPAGTRRVRIMTNLKIYWDQILLDSTPEASLTRLSDVPLAGASLGFRGYPRELRGEPSSDIRYVYEEVSRTGPYARHAGNYTRYGDALELLAGADDRFAILGSGDEVQVEFDASRLAPLPAGWTRDYFFYADGFAKDMDFYAAHGYTVEPLPFHAMRGYPYAGAETYPREELFLQYQLDLNTRQVSGREAPSYRFDYGREPAAPPAKKPSPAQVSKNTVTLEPTPKPAGFTQQSVGSYAVDARQQMAAAEDSPSTLITLRLKDAPPEAVYGEIARQAKLQISTAGGTWPQLSKINIDVERQPFWKIMHQLAGQTGMAPASYQPGRREVRLNYNPNWGKAPSSYNGCALFVADSITFNRNVSLVVQGQDRSSLYLDIATYIDPGIDVLQVTGLRLEEALDENGASLRNSQRPTESASQHGSGFWRVRTQFAYSPTIGRRIVRLKGSVRIAQCTRRETWEISDIRNAKDVVRKLSHGTYTVKGLTGGEADSGPYYVNVQIQRAADLGYPDPLIRFSVLDDIHLLDARGQSYVISGGGGGGAGGQLEYRVNFTSQGKDVQDLGPPTKLIWEIPIAMKELVVPLELKDISLPPIGNR